MWELKRDSYKCSERKGKETPVRRGSPVGREKGCPVNREGGFITARETGGPEIMSASQGGARD